MVDLIYTLRGQGVSLDPHVQTIIVEGGHPQRGCQERWVWPSSAHRTYACKRGCKWRWGWCRKLTYPNWVHVGGRESAEMGLPSRLLGAVRHGTKVLVVPKFGGRGGNVGISASCHLRVD